MVEISIPSPPFLPTLLNGLSEFGQENIQLLLLFLLAIWLAYRLAAEYAFSLFSLADFQHALRMIWDIKFPLSRRIVVLQQGEEKQAAIPPARALYGGPISLYMDAQKGYAAVLEQTASRVEIVGPQDVFPVHPAGFVRLRQVVDLHDQQLELPLEARTKDGIPVKVNEADFVCHVKGILQDNQRSTYQSCDKRQVEKLVFRHWIGQDWENPQKRRKALRDLVSTSLKDFISHHSFMEVLADTGSLAGTIRDIRLTPHLLEQFAIDFNENSSEHGLHLLWTGRGDWQLPPEFDTQAFLPGFRDYYVDWMRSHHDFQTHAAIQLQRREISRLVRHVLKLTANLRQSTVQEDEMMLKLAQHYDERITSAMHLIESRGDKVPKEWKEVAGYLKQIVS